MKIGIFSEHDVSAAYSCLFYLKDKLEQKYQVDMWAKADRNKILNNNNLYLFNEQWYKSIRRFRIYASKIHMFLLGRKYDVIIINDLDFFRMAYWLKKIFPQKKVIHYNTEIQDKDVKYPWHTVRFYEKHASYPDAIIECLNERANYRKKKYNIHKKIYVINNTLPTSVLNFDKNHDMKIEKYFTFSEDYPIVVYAGGCNLSRALGDVIDAAKNHINEFNFLFFCYGDKEDFDIVKRKCDKYSNCRLYHAVDRKTLFDIMKKCNIGIQYYDPTYSVNHLYASPSKFYEYIALGLKVISSNNEGINHMIEEDKLGWCLKNDETISDCFDRVKGITNTEKERIIKVFEEKYSYEASAYKVIDAIMNEIGCK